MTTEVTKSYNCYSPIKAIVKLLEDSTNPLSPFTIAEKTGKNPSTIRVYLRRLVKEGTIHQVTRGLYSNIDRHGVRLPLLRCHNLCFVGLCPWLRRKFPSVVEWTGDVKVEVIFGLERHKVTINVNGGGNPKFGGMDYSTVVFALNRGFDIVFEQTGHDFPDEFLVTVSEFNRDFEGVRLDGATCFTKKSFLGVLERLYQKDKSTVRFEQKISQEMKPLEFCALMQGGVSYYNFQQLTFRVLQDQQKILESLRFSNEQLVKVGNFLQGIIRRLDNGL